MSLPQHSLEKLKSIKVAAEPSDLRTCTRNDPEHMAKLLSVNLIVIAVCRMWRDLLLQPFLPVKTLEESQGTLQGTGEGTASCC